VTVRKTADALSVAVSLLAVSIRDWRFIGTERTYPECVPGISTHARFSQLALVSEAVLALAGLGAGFALCWHLSEPNLTDFLRTRCRYQSAAFGISFLHSARINFQLMFRRGPAQLHPCQPLKRFVKLTWLASR